MRGPPWRLVACRVLEFALKSVVEHTGEMVDLPLLDAYGLDGIKAEITKSAKRPIELCEAIPNALMMRERRNNTMTWRLRYEHSILDDVGINLITKVRR